MFENIKKRNRAENSPTTAIEQSLSRLAIAQDFEKAKKEEIDRNAPDKETVMRSEQVLESVQDVYGGYIKKALARRMGLEDIKSSLVEAWNSGAIPRVVPGVIYRGSGFDLHILHGEVPLDIFDHFVNAGVDLIPSDRFPEGKVFLDFPDDTIPAEPDPNNPSAFYVEQIRLPQLNQDTDFDVRQVTAQLNAVTALLGQSQP